MESLLDTVALSLWSNEGRAGRWDHVCHALHGVILFAGIAHPDVWEDAGTLRDIAHRHWMDRLGLSFKTT